MTPLVGSHLIEFGDGSDLDKKFNRLFIFYKEVLVKTGFDKYSKIDVGYAGQVIGTKKGSNSTKADSIQAIKNIEQLIRLARQLQPDTIHMEHMKPLEQNTETEPALTNYEQLPTQEDSAETIPDTKTHARPEKPTKSLAVFNQKKQATSKSPIKKPTNPKSLGNNQKPKAVMPAKNESLKNQKLETN